MVTDRREDSGKTPGKQGVEQRAPEPNEINASTPYDFNGKNLTPYGGLLPVITMLEKLGFESLVEGDTYIEADSPCHELVRIRAEHRTGLVHRLFTPEPVALHRARPDTDGHPQSRQTACPIHLLAIRERAASECGQTTSDGHAQDARKGLGGGECEAGDRVIDTDTTVHTLYGKQMGGRKGYNPKNKGKMSYQPILSFIAETREYVWGELRNGDRPDGKDIAQHIRNVCAALPTGVKQIFGRADSGFYCREAVEAYEECNVRFVVSARKTTRLTELLRQAEWKPSNKTDADMECEFRYQPQGWSKQYRFVALRYE
jgi:hypothetical protein